jgi:hypothetical protein
MIRRSVVERPFGVVATPTPLPKGFLMSKRSSVVLIAFGLLVAVMPFWPSPAFADPESGCPPGYELRSVASLAEAGNAPVPGLVDAAGNADGYVCAHALPDAVCVAKVHPDPCLVETVYVFKDN